MTNMQKRVVFRTIDPLAQPPMKSTPGSAGVDLRAIEGGRLEPGGRKLVRTGLTVDLPEGTVGDIRPRSGLAFKHGVTVLNAPGTIDSDYEGELGVLLINLDPSEPFVWGAGDRVAQFVVLPLADVELDGVDFAYNVERGAGGWGSTGVE